jgi:hypothetical protein
MANFSGCLLSTPFQVKDRKVFLADPDVQRIIKHVASVGPYEEGFFEEEDGCFAFGWCGQYPPTILTYWDDDNLNEIEITNVIQTHTLPGDVCRIGVSDNDRLRHIGSKIVFVASKGIAYFKGLTEWSDKLGVDALKAQAAEFSTAVAAIV